MTIRPFRAAMGREGGMTVSSNSSFVSDVNRQVSHLISNYEAFIENIDSQAGDIVMEALEATFEKSQNIVYLEKNTTKGYSQVEIGYAKGGTPDYAVAVHEDLDVHHASPTQAKFLQQPLEEDAQDIEARIYRGFQIAAGLDGGTR
jgi:hypothetical protein